MSKKNRTKRLAMAGVLIALAFIFSYVESLLPSFSGVPGVKPGFSNIVTMVALYAIDWKYAVVISLVRVVLSGLTFNGMVAMLYGLAGSVLSLIVMIVLSKLNLFNTAAVSIAGGVAHNIGQILVAWVLLNGAIVYYLPVLLVSGVIAGLIVGVIAGFVISRVKKMSIK